MNRNRDGSKCEAPDGWVRPASVPPGYGMCMACDCPEIKSVKRIGVCGIVGAVAGIALLREVPLWIRPFIDLPIFWLCMALCVVYGVMAMRASAIQHQWNDQPWYYPHMKPDTGNKIFPPFPR